MNIPHTCTEKEQKELARLIDILRYLRSEQGCPWDKEQSVASLRPHIIEEPTELLEAIGLVLDDPNEEHYENLSEELGDVLLVLIMMMVVYEDETQKGRLESIVKALNEKLIRRHPHVFFGEDTFSDPKLKTRDELASQWDQIKTQQEGKKKVDLKQYKNYMHSLERTKEVQKRLSKEQGKFKEPIAQKTTQLAYMIQSLADLAKDLPPKDTYEPSPPHIEKAIGESLFALIDIARSLRVSPTSALERRLAFEIHSQHIT